MRDEAEIDDDRLSDALESLTNRAHTAEVELGRLRADNQRLTAELAKTQDASATLYGAFEDAAEARDHATAQVLIQNGETNRAATEAGLEQQRAERAEAERDALRAAVDAAAALHWENPGSIKICVHCAQSWPCATYRVLSVAALGATTTQTSDEADDVPYNRNGFCVCDDGRPARDCGIAAHRASAGASTEEPAPTEKHAE